MAKLSVCIITHNEENNIANCLESVRWADEIIVTDCESIDRTVEIVKQYPVKLLTKSNDNNLNINKQFGIDHATSEWVLYLDADESLSDELQEQIKEAVRKNDPEFNGYDFPIKNYIFGKWSKFGGNYPNYRLRLFRKGAGHFPCKHVHEHFIVEGKTGQLDGLLIHDNLPTISRGVHKIDRNSTFQSEYLYQKKYELTLFKAPWCFFGFPFLRFMQVYILRQGFRDGYPGFIFAGQAAVLEFLAFAKLWELQQQRKD